MINYPKDMRMKLFYLAVLTIFLFSFTPDRKENVNEGRADYYEYLPDDKKFPSLLPKNVSTASPENYVVDSIYNRLNLQAHNLSKKVFYDAYKGYEFLLSKGVLLNPDYLTICDYGQSSSAKRLYVIDLATCRLVFNTYVSHGKKSGEEFATSFSNIDNSKKSSLGFMVTGSIYTGRAGYSLHLSGMEEGFNDHVFRRGIVIHGSYYVTAKRADEDIEMGRSFGCPAVPHTEHRAIISMIKEGSCFYAASSDKYYLNNSRIVNAKFAWPVLQNRGLQQQTNDLSLGNSNNNNNIASAQ
jgi:hypothetical protein